MLFYNENIIDNKLVWANFDQISKCFFAEEFVTVKKIHEEGTEIHKYDDSEVQEIKTVNETQKNKHYRFETLGGYDMMF